jgi:AAA family ATP:ADP antiporter
MTRTALFYTIVVIFMAFFAVFAFVLYPSHELIHPHRWAESLEGVRKQQRFSHAY